MVHNIINLETIQSQTALEVGTAMTDHHQNSNVDYGGSSADEVNSCVVENSMWDEWTHPSNVGDEVSTSNFLPDLTTSSTTSSGLSFHQTDMLSSWMSTFHPLGLAHPSLANTEPIDIDPHPALFMHDEDLGAALDQPHSTSLGTDSTYARTTSIGSQPTFSLYKTEDAPPILSSGTFSGNNGLKATNVSRHLQTLGPQSPSSPLAIQNGMLNPLGDPWDGSCPSGSSLPSWTVSSQDFCPRVTTSHSRSYIPDHSMASAIANLEEVGGCARVFSRPRHTDIFIGPNGTFEATPGGWKPQFYDGMPETTTTSVMKPMKMMAILREAGESSTSTGLHSHVVNSEDRTTGSFVLDYKCDDQNVWPGKHRLELAVDGDDTPGSLQLKRSNLSVDHGTSSALRWGDEGMRGEILRTYNYPSGSLVSQATNIIAIGPALNTNGKPRARRGSATDPQSVYARQRRERINDRLKTLQQLVPNGAKVDIVTMLDEAYDYVKFLQHQVTLLKSDDFWMHATPYKYNDMDISNLPLVQSQELESSAT